MRKEARILFDKLGINIDMEVPVCQLSVAQQQFVEIAKALSLKARILILDEPTATLTPSEAEHLFGIMRELKAQGVTMVFISHHLEEIFEICDRITVLRNGEFVGEYMAKELSRLDLINTMVGREINESNYAVQDAGDASALYVLMPMRV